MASERKQARVAIWEDDITTFETLARDWQMSDTELATKILSAGLRAIRDNGMVASLPLRFSIPGTYDRSTTSKLSLNERHGSPEKTTGSRRS